MKVLVAIPVYNEAQYVEGVLAEVRRYASDVLVVDDGSTDGTGELLAGIDGVHVIRHKHNLGYGKASIDAFNCAICGEYDWVITMDCDGQHEPAAITEFVAAAMAGDCDIVSGSRYLNSSASADCPPADRRSINAEITDLLNRELDLRITDAFCGFKAYRVKKLRCLNITETGYAMPLQLWVHAVRQGLRIREIPVRLIYNDPNRTFGGPLDDAEHRKRYYLSVFHNAMCEEAGGLAGCYCRSVGEPCCRC